MGRFRRRHYELYRMRGDLDVLRRFDGDLLDFVSPSITFWVLKVIMKTLFFLLKEIQESLSAMITSRKSSTR